MRSLLLVLLAVLLVGCGTPQITIPAGQAAVAYGQVRSDYAVAKLIITSACARGTLDAESCDSAAAIDVRAQTLRASIERALANPTVPVDWAQVMAYSASVTELLIKLGLSVAK